MTKTLEQDREVAAARVITAHYHRARGACACGERWTPLHVAKALAAAGCLGPTPEPMSTLHDPEKCAPCRDGVTEWHRSRTDKPNLLRRRDAS